MGLTRIACVLTLLTCTTQGFAFDWSSTEFESAGGNQGATEDNAKWWLCFTYGGPRQSPRPYAIFESFLSSEDLEKQFQDFARQQGWSSNKVGCRSYPTLNAAEADHEDTERRNQQYAQPWIYQRSAWVPQEQPEKTAEMGSVGEKSGFSCGTDGRQPPWVRAYFESALPLDAIEEQWRMFVEGTGKRSIGCKRAESFTRVRAEVAEWMRMFPERPGNWIDWQPVEAVSQSDDGTWGLKTLTLRYGSGGKGRPGYAHAEIDLNYRFIACMGEVHVAYSLDPKSVRPDSRYMLRDDTMVDAAGTPPPEVSSVGFTATVGANLGSPHVSELVSSSRIWMIGEGNAGPALGYGCFSGQTEKLGTVADIVRGKHDVKKVEAILNDALSLGNGLINDPSTLTNAALESGSGKAAGEARTTDDRASGDVSEDRATASESASVKSAADERYEAAMREYERLEAERQQKIAEIEAAKQEMAAQQAASAERAKAVQDEYQRQLAAHQAQVDAADRARAEYEAQLRALGLAPPAVATAPPPSTSRSTVQCQRATPTSACVSNQ